MTAVELDRLGGVGDLGAHFLGRRGFAGVKTLGAEQRFDPDVGKELVPIWLGELLTLRDIARFGVSGGEQAHAFSPHLAGSAVGSRGTEAEPILNQTSSCVIERSKLA